MELPSSVKLKGRSGVQTCELRAPQSYALRFDVWRAAADNPSRAYAAALGVCSTKVGKGCKLRGDILDYGGQVIDRLLGEGVSYRAIQAAGAIAFAIVVDGLTDLLDEVDATADFSAAPADTSTE